MRTPVSRVIIPAIMLAATSAAAQDAQPAPGDANAASDVTVEAPEAGDDDAAAPAAIASEPARASDAPRTAAEDAATQEEAVAESGPPPVSAPSPAPSNFGTSGTINRAPVRPVMPSSVAPQVDEAPSETAAAPSPEGREPAEEERSPAAAATLPAVPDATASPLPAPAPPASGPATRAPAPPVRAASEPEPAPVDPDVLAALRETYGDLRSREAAVSALSEPATEETRAAQAAVAARIEEAEAELTLLRWRADVMAYFSETMAANGAGALPDTVPTGMTPALAAAATLTGALYYAAPTFTDQTVAGSFAEPRAVLRVAEMPGAQLVWDPQEGFVFMTNTSLEVYQ